jgi:hypothetical protein
VEVIPPKHSDNNAAETDIDPSCLDALDDQLLVSPIDSFVDVCWAEAVDKHDSELGGDSPTLYSAPMFAPQKVNDYNMLDDYHDLDPLGSDNEKWYGDEINDVPVKADIRYVCFDSQRHDRALADLFNRSKSRESSQMNPPHPQLVAVYPH